jgi:hypothetical protein
MCALVWRREVGVSIYRWGSKTSRLELSAWRPVEPAPRPVELVFTKAKPSSKNLV